MEASFNKFLSALRRKASARGLCKSGGLYGHMTPQECLKQHEKRLMWSGDIFMIIRDVMGSNSKGNGIK